MIKHTELRTGNQLIYFSEEGPLRTKIDWQDIKWCEEDPEGFNKVHAPIILTEPIMTKIRRVERPDFVAVEFSVSGPGERQVENNYWSREVVSDRRLHLSPNYHYEPTGDGRERVKKLHPEFWFIWICSYGTGSSWFLNIRDCHVNPLKYFHDFQNLFYGLSGKELLLREDAGNGN